MLCNGDHLPAVNNIIYLVRQALVQCFWGPKAGFHQEQQRWHCAQGLVLGAPEEGGNVHCSPPPADRAWGQVEGFVGESFFSVFLAQLGLLLRGHHLGGVSCSWDLHGLSCLLVQHSWEYPSFCDFISAAL